MSKLSTLMPCSISDGPETPDEASEYLIKEGPYCYECCRYLGPEYKDGDLCLECWEFANGAVNE